MLRCTIAYYQSVFEIYNSKDALGGGGGGGSLRVGHETSRGGGRTPNALDSLSLVGTTPPT